jgi:hypothetical protein
LQINQFKIIVTVYLVFVCTYTKTISPGFLVKGETRGLANISFPDPPRMLRAALLQDAMSYRDQGAECDCNKISELLEAESNLQPVVEREFLKSVSQIPRQGVEGS